MEEMLNQLLIQQSSIERQIVAIKAVLLNFKGVYIETADGPQQGLIKFGVQPVDPEPVVPVEEGV